jgi:hypothetical protein
MRYIILFLILTQSCALKKMGGFRLPDAVPESSGVCVADGKGFLTLNDSGNPAELIHVTGNRRDTLFSYPLVKARNVDWEELTREGNKLYIGDFGNNRNNRKDQTIYISHASSPGYMLGKVSFSFQDQIAFPPEHEYKMFDCEAMVVHADTVFLFTKNRTKPFTGLFGVYTLSLNNCFDSVCVARRISTGKAPRKKPVLMNRVTAAALSPNAKILAVMSPGYLWFYHFNGSKTNFSEPFKTVKFIKPAQREAVCFINNNTIAVTNESFRFVKGKLKLYQLRFAED